MTSVGVLDAEIASGILRVDLADKANHEYGQAHAFGEPSVSPTWIGVGCVAVELPDDLTLPARVILEVRDGWTMQPRRADTPHPLIDRVAEAGRR